VSVVNDRQGIDSRRSTRSAALAIGIEYLRRFSGRESRALRPEACAAAARSRARQKFRAKSRAISVFLLDDLVVMPKIYATDMTATL
jgi:hypothetical protein